MGKKERDIKKTDIDSSLEKGGLLKSLKKETLDGIWAIVFLIVACFLILSPFGKTGIVGDFTYSILFRFFGWGYYLLSLILILIAISFIKDISRNLATPKTIGGFLFFVAGVGILGLPQINEGGMVGKLIATPLIKLFGITTTILGLVAIILISIMIIFDVPIIKYITSLFKKKSKEISNNNPELKIGGVVDSMKEDQKRNLQTENENRNANEINKNNQPKENIDGKENGGLGSLMFMSKRTLDLGDYVPPPISLLEQDSGKPGVGDIKANANIIKRTLQNFGIQVEMDEVSVGPSVTRYSLKPAEGVKLSRIVGLHNDLALALAAHPLRIEAPIPGKSLVGIEIPNSTKTKVGLGSLLRADDWKNSEKSLLMSLGKGVTGQSYFADLAKMPHLLIAGTTGSGKSVTIHALICSLLYRNSPEKLKFIMIDPKRVELTMYNNIPHLLTPVITDAKKTILSLRWAAQEMSRRYDILEKNGSRDIHSYHKKVFEPAIAKARELKNPENIELPESMPYIAIVIDELADIMQAYPRELEAGIVRLAQMSRAVGIHLIISTQRPSVNVITGLIKANIPSRVALQVSSQIDSRTILDQPGAEKLLGQGDMLFMSGEMAQPRRIQSAFISEEEVKNVVSYLIKSHESDLNKTIDLDQKPEHAKNSIFEVLNSTDESVGGGRFDNESSLDDSEDDLYEEARRIIMEAGKASTSYLQRKLRIGYSRAARLMDLLEEKGVIGAQAGAKPREIIGSGSNSNISNDNSQSSEVPKTNNYYEQ
jgi:S-DNA-T family DNA segregation ATPase FtsK/SpoIIIE